MAKGNRGGKRNQNRMTPLQAFKENARQFNEAKVKGLRAGATKLEYTDITGKKFVFFRNGNRWSDKPNTMEQNFSKTKGTYKAKFKNGE